MQTITMTELNQRVSEVTRQVTQSGESVRVTNRGRAVLRIVPEPAVSEDPLASLISQGLASPPSRPRSRYGGRSPVKLSRDLDELIAEARADVEA
jgi:prevent-host-death family protein